VVRINPERRNSEMTKLLDPVCGMTVDETALRASGHDDVAFCAPGCRTAFVKDPGAYPARLEAEAGEVGKCSCGEQADGVCRCGDDHDH
jgi:YHS domain-containing protein